MNSIRARIIKKALFGLVLQTISLVPFSEQTYAYKPFDLSLDSINFVLNRSNSQSIQAYARADVSFICADIKYHNGTLKFCECGDGTYMSFTHDMRMHINKQEHTLTAPGWGFLWHYLSHYKLPIWHVGYVRNWTAMSLDLLALLGGQHIDTLQELESDPLFEKSCERNFKMSNSINNYSGFIVYTAQQRQERDGAGIKDFMQKHPEFIVINTVVRPHLKHKQATYSLFQEAGMSSFLPQYKFCPGVYNQSQVRKILRTFNSEHLIIKPVRGSLSMGAIMTTKETLDTTLRSIFEESKKIDPAHKNIHKLYHNKPFMISEYIPSRIIHQEGKAYDPTMRVMLLLSHDKGVVTTTLIGAFWKIPLYHLEDLHATLTQKHITNAHLFVDDPDDFYSGILVDESDMRHIRSLMSTALGAVYKNALKKF